MKQCPSCKAEFDSTEWKCPACGWGPEVRDGFITFAPSLADEGGGFAPEYFEGLAQNEPGNFWFENRNRLLAWALDKYFPNCKTLLEIGCGTGFVLSRLHQDFPAVNFTGSEVFIEGLRFAAKRLSGVQLFQMDARNIPFKEEFDVIGAFDVLEHIEEDEQVLQEMYRAVKPSGGIIITVPQHKWLWSQLDDMSYHKRRYSRKELVDRVRSAGFDVAFTGSFVSFLLPAMLASRLRKKRGDIDIQGEFKIGARANSILSAVMRSEAALIRAGVRFPAGGSLLLIAKK